MMGSARPTIGADTRSLRSRRRPGAGNTTGDTDMPGVGSLAGRSFALPIKTWSQETPTGFASRHALFADLVWSYMMASFVGRIAATGCNVNGRPVRAQPGPGRRLRRPTEAGRSDR